MVVSDYWGKQAFLVQAIPVTQLEYQSKHADKGKET